MSGHRDLRDVERRSETGAEDTLFTPPDAKSDTKGGQVHSGLAGLPSDTVRRVEPGGNQARSGSDVQGSGMSSKGGSTRSGDAQGRMKQFNKQ